MSDFDWALPKKPYDLRERLFHLRLSDRSSDAVSAHPRTGCESLSYQVLKSGTSAGANFEEADDGSSPRDKPAKQRIVLRELKETRFRLRVLRECGLLTESHDPVIRETIELIKIVATLIRNETPPDD